MVFISFVLVSQGCEPFVAYCSLCIGQTSTMSSWSRSETPQDRPSMLESRVVTRNKSWCIASLHHCAMETLQISALSGYEQCNSGISPRHGDEFRPVCRYQLQTIGSIGSAHGNFSCGSHSLHSRILTGFTRSTTLGMMYHSYLLICRCLGKNWWRVYVPESLSDSRCFGKVKHGTMYIYV